MIEFAKIEVAKREIYRRKKSYKILDVDVDNMTVSELIEVKKGLKFLTGYLRDVIRPLIFTMPIIREYVKTSDDDNVMSCGIDKYKFLEKLKAYGALKSGKLLD